MDIKDALQKPLESMNGDNVQSSFKKIAENLFNNFCIQCGKKEYYFAEVEFYYYDKEKYLIDKEKNKWNTVTYPRTGYSAGDFFFHLSGFDICFNSHYDEKDAKFGGILVRSIKDNAGVVTAGPLICKDLILNSCNNEMPKLKPYHSEIEIKPVPTIRSLGKVDMNNRIDGILNLCFYDGSIKDWKPAKQRFDTKTGEIVKAYSPYKTDRFV